MRFLNIAATLVLIVGSTYILLLVLGALRPPRMRLLNMTVALVLIAGSTYILLVGLGALRNLIWGYGEAPAWIHWVLGIGGTTLATLGIATAVRMLVRAARRP